MVTFGFNRTALRTLQPKLHSVYCALSLISRRADVIWAPPGCDLTPLDYHLWEAVEVKCYIDRDN